MTSTDIEDACRSLKRDPMQLSNCAKTGLRLGRDEIGRIIPHRPPFAFIDRIAAVDLDASMIEVQIDIAADDPLFSGHFPGRPVYPGVLQIEAMGQAGLCLAFFTKNQTINVTSDARPVDGLFTRVHHAVFQRLVTPGVQLAVRARLLDDNDMTGIIAAQALVGGEVCSFGILEVFYP